MIKPSRTGCSKYSPEGLKHDGNQDCIRCELQPDSYLLNRLYELMAQASLTGETDSIRGNSTIFHVRSDEIEIVSVFFGEGFSYTHEEFRDQLTKWRQAWRKYRGL